MGRNKDAGPGRDEIPIEAWKCVGGEGVRVAIRPAMLYGSECWPLMKVQANRMVVAEMRMLRWTCGKTILDMIPNGAFQRNLQVVIVVNKTREGRLRWFGHVKKRP
ncbi:hypothetical protein Tco_0797614 [Tanacetum coccineum]